MSATEEAESHFLSAIRYSPNHVNAHYNLGQVYRKVNRSDEAERMLERCIRLDTAYTPAYLLLTKLYSGRGLQAEVGRLLRHVTRLQPTSADHLAEYAAWLHDSGRSWEALHYYRKALQLTATHRTSLLGALRVLRAKGQYPRVHQLMIRAHIMYQDHRGGVVYTGDLYIRSPTTETSHRRLEETNNAACNQVTTSSEMAVPSVSVHLEQDSNKSRQTRCGPRHRGRRGLPRQERTSTRNIKVASQALLVQNLLETL